MSSEPAVAPAATPLAKFPLWRALMIAAGVVLACFGCLQLVPINRTNPPVMQEPNWDSPQTRAFVKRACFDCHSNETVRPWYASVAPVSWAIYFDVVRGRNEMHFSEWDGSRGTRIANRIEEAVSSKEMPPGNYLMLHPEAHLSSDERQQLIEGFKATFSQP